MMSAFLILLVRPQPMVTWTRAQELFAYPFGFHSAAADSGWVAPVESKARAVTLNGPGAVSTSRDHRRHDHGLSAGSRSAWRQL
jgi:hypothetical protein